MERRKGLILLIQLLIRKKKTFGDNNLSEEVISSQLQDKVRQEVNEFLGHLKQQKDLQKYVELLKTISNSAPGALVEELIFLGPNAPSWKRGLRSIRGARGPRDTYG